MMDGTPVGLGTGEGVGEGADAGFLPHEIGEKAGSVFEG
jgi:hypothetical protein